MSCGAPGNCSWFPQGTAVHSLGTAGLYNSENSNDVGSRIDKHICALQCIGDGQRSGGNITGIFKHICIPVSDLIICRRVYFSKITLTIPLHIYGNNYVYPVAKNQ